MSHSNNDIKPVHLSHWLAVGFGSGLSPIAPGTMGTLAGVPIYLLVHNFTPWFYLFLVCCGFFIGIVICGKTARDFGTHDHASIVWDEIVGFLLTMFYIPFSWQNIVLGFILFRLFDIIKPWPICWADDKIHGGLGIMLDDVLAGCFACASLHLVMFLIA